MERKACKSVFFILAAIPLYVMSFGPVCWFYEPPVSGTHYDCPDDGWYWRLYWPLGHVWFYLTPKPLHDVYGRYIEFGVTHDHFVLVPLRPASSKYWPKWYGFVPRNRSAIRGRSLTLWERVRVLFQ